VLSTKRHKFKFDATLIIKVEADATPAEIEAAEDKAIEVAESAVNHYSSARAHFWPLGQSPDSVLRPDEGADA